MTDENVWVALKRDAKKRHAKRVEQTPQRIAYALRALENLQARLEYTDIEFRLTNAKTGQIVVTVDDLSPVPETFVFYAGTGKIQGYDVRGIENLVALILDIEEQYDDELGGFEHGWSNYGWKDC